MKDTVVSTPFIPLHLSKSLDCGTISWAYPTHVLHRYRKPHVLSPSFVAIVEGLNCGVLDSSLRI